MSRLTGPLARDVAVVVAWFVGLGILAAVLWWQLTPLAEYTRTATNAEMGEEELGRQVAADGWYVVIAAVGGLLSGVGLMSLRRRDPLAMVVLVTLGSLLCAWVMLRVGLWLGPADPKSALPHAAVGAKVPLQLKPHASGVVYVWPITALLGAIGVIWTGEGRRPATPEEDPQAPRSTPDGESSDDAVSVDQPG
jgi:hypothetical protein